jgi:Leucine-rich repeat (LRR) protein
MHPLLAILLASEINLGNQWITDADLARVARNQDLQKLDLSHTKITDAGLERLKPLRHVRELDLYYAEYMTEDGIAHLRDWKDLERLNLRGTRVTSKVFEHLARLTNLKSLDLAFTQIDDEGFEHLSGLLKLEHLAIGGNRLNGSCLTVLKLLPALQDLDVGGIQRVDSGLWGLPLTEQNLGRIAELRQLRRLNLAAATLENFATDRPERVPERAELRDLSILRPLANLEYLDLTKQPVLAGTIHSLAVLPALRELRLGLASKLDDTAVEPLLALKNLKSLYLSGANLSPAALDRLKPLVH